MEWTEIKDDAVMRAVSFRNVTIQIDSCQNKAIAWMHEAAAAENGDRFVYLRNWHEQWIVRIMQLKMSVKAIERGRKIKNKRSRYSARKISWTLPKSGQRQTQMGNEKAVMYGESREKEAIEKTPKIRKRSTLSVLEDFVVKVAEIRYRERLLEAWKEI